MKNKTLYYRNLTKNDCEFIMQNWVGHSIIFNDNIKKEELLSLIELWDAKKHNDEYFEIFGIVNQNVLAGTFSLYQKKIDIKEKAVYLGLEIDKSNRQKGIATDTIALAIQLVKEKGFKKILSQVRIDNIPSINLHKKCGFKIIESTLDSKGNRVNNYQLDL